jgi:hypothetical protein
MRSLMFCTPHLKLLGDKIEKNEMGGVCNAYGGEKRRVQGLLGKPGGKRTLGRHRRGWEVNIKMDIQEWNVRVYSGSSWLRIGTSGGHL